MANSPGIFQAIADEVKRRKRVRYVTNRHLRPDGKLSKWQAKKTNKNYAKQVGKVQASQAAHAKATARKPAKSISRAAHARNMTSGPK